MTSSSAAMFAVTITSVAIAVAFAGHRLWVRAVRRREVGPCDVLISFSAVCYERGKNKNFMSNRSVCGSEME
jgi:hypothetical protein